jgi:hypothetical protein
MSTTAKVAGAVVMGIAKRYAKAQPIEGIRGNLSSALIRKGHSTDDACDE